MSVRVIIASKNPVKIQTTTNGFTKMFPESNFVFEGISVPSGVPEQPMSYKETFQGALNRAKNAMCAVPDADFWVGLEGGIDLFENTFETAAWIVIISKDGKVGKSRTASVELSKPVMDLIQSGLSLGEADDKIFAQTNSGQNEGVTGSVTHGLLPRIPYYEQAVILALAPFKNPDIYFGC
jgi:inosine/xanthosine triphosphatase